MSLILALKNHREFPNWDNIPNNTLEFKYIDELGQQETLTIRGDLKKLLSYLIHSPEFNQQELKQLRNINAEYEFFNKQFREKIRTNPTCKEQWDDLILTMGLAAGLDFRANNWLCGIKPPEPALSLDDVSGTK